MSCCVAVDRLNRGRWSAPRKWQGNGHFVGGADVPLRSFSPVHSSLFLVCFKIDRPVGMSLTRAEVVLFSRIRNQNWTCSGCCNFFLLQLRNLCFFVFFFCAPVFLWFGSSLFMRSSVSQFLSTCVLHGAYALRRRSMAYVATNKLVPPVKTYL